VSLAAISAPDGFVPIRGHTILKSGIGCKERGNQNEREDPYQKYIPNNGSEAAQKGGHRKSGEACEHPDEKTDCVQYVNVS